MAEDHALELLQSAAGLDPELVDKGATRALVLVEGVRLAAGPVIGEHQLAAQGLAEGVLRDEGLELGHELRVPPQGEVGGHAPLESEQPQLLQSADRGLCERLVREVGERRPSPQGQRISERLGRGRRLFVLGLLDEPLERPDVERVRLDVEHVAGGGRLDAVGVRTERLAQP